LQNRLEAHAVPIRGNGQKAIEDIGADAGFLHAAATGKELS
jgi:hypothetical protein